MPHERTKKWVWVVVCCALTLTLLACGGPALLAHTGALPSFDADIQIWQGTMLSLHSTSARSCAIAARCPYQVRIESALSIWLIWQERQHGNVDTFGKRLLYIPAAEPATR